MSSTSAKIRDRWDSFTKPPGSLGQLEEFIVRIGAIQDYDPPRVRPASLLLFAGDHGIAEEHVSAYPPSVTADMVKNIKNGGAAINAFCEEADVALSWYNVGSRSKLQSGGETIANGTANFLHEPAMTDGQLEQALDTGKQAFEKELENGVEIIGLGEIGIGNTTVASALASVVTDYSVKQLVGPGTGLDEGGMEHKCSVIKQAIQFHNPAADQSKEILRCLGGFELASHVGCLLEAQRQSIPVVLDGFITTVSATLAVEINPDVRSVILAGHRSPEPGHQLLLDDLGLEPLVDVEMRLGEGTGAVMALQSLSMASRAYRQMATFDEAGVAGKDP